MIAFVAAALARDLEPGWIELRAGTGLWQLPTISHNNYERVWPAWNGHFTLLGAVGPRPRVFAGLHIAGLVHRWDHPLGTTRVSDTVVRLEGRVGTRRPVGSNTDVDLSFGVSLDATSPTELRPGAVLAAGLHWLGGGERVRPTAVLEGRIAPVFWGASTLQFCPNVCDQSWTFNNGGTGVIAGVGLLWP